MLLMLVVKLPEVPSCVRNEAFFMSHAARDTGFWLALHDGGWLAASCVRWWSYVTSVKEL